MADFHILAFESSSTLCSAALLSQTSGEVRVRALSQSGRAAHSEHILPLAQRLLADAGLAPEGLSAVAFGQGPGGFTGLRVACAAAQGVAVALGVPVLPVDSLWAIAVEAAGPTPSGVHVVLQDARLQEIYAAVYRAPGQGWVTLQAPVLLARADVGAWIARESAGWAMQAGSAWQVHGDATTAFEGLAGELQTLGAYLGPEGAAPARASTVARLAARAWLQGHVLDAARVAPAYVRDKVAYTTRERGTGLGGNPAVDAQTRAVHVMTLADVDEVASVERQVQSFPWSRQNFADSLAAGQHGWIVRRMGRLEGFALLLDTPDMAHLLVIGVRPDAQRRGVGSLLLRQCTDHCRHAALPALTLEVRASNAAAIAFYHHHGFRRVGLRRGYYPSGQGRREDAWLMTLALDGRTA